MDLSPVNNTDKLNLRASELSFALWVSGVQKPLRVEIKNSPIYGIGIFSKEDILEGDIILTESPPDCYSPDVRDDYAVISKVVRSLSTCEEESCAWNVAGGTNSSGHRHYSRCFYVSLHGFGSSSNDTYLRFQGTFFAAACVTHSGKPNALMVWSEEKNELVFRASRYIEKGEQVTVAHWLTSRENEVHPLDFTCNLLGWPVTTAPEDKNKGSNSIKGDGKLKEDICKDCKPMEQEDGEALAEDMVILNLAGGDPAAASASTYSGFADVARGYSELTGKNEESDYNTGDAVSDDDWEDSDDDDDDYLDDLDNLDIIPGLHSWLE